MLHRIETGIARAITYICHPMLLSTYALVVLFNMEVYFSIGIPAKAKWMIVLLVFIITGLLPMLLAVLMSRLGIVKTLHMEQREERIWPFVITALFYYLAYYLVKQLDLSTVYIIFMLGAFLTVIVGLVISFFWKISVHMIGMGGIVGAFTGLSLRLMIDMPLLIVILILLSGLTGFARLKLLAHTPAQVLAGFVAGFGVFILLFLAR
jgi:membrane-associated phospholipid phosphatase